MNLKGKVALITGGSRGIGRAVAVMLARKRCNVAINYVKNTRKAEETIEEVKGYGVKGVAVKADVSNFDEVKEMVSKVIGKFHRVDILVNNAGIYPKISDIEDITDEEWNKVININLRGVFNCCKAVIPYMKKHGGKIVNISSIAGRMGGISGPHYSASKAGVIGLTYSLAIQLVRYGILVNAVAPNVVNTDMAVQLTEEQRKNIIRETPIGRMAEPNEVAHAVISLIENDYITAEVLDVNGGRWPS